MIITAGIYKNRKILSPDEKISRPTLSKTRMGVFNTLYSLLGDFEGKSFLDMFGGSGIMGLEALSRGFLHVKVFELNKKSANIIKQNYKILGAEIDLSIGDSLKLITKTDEIFDVVYVDPPYESGFYDEIIEKAKGKILVTESPNDYDFSKYDVIKSKTYGSNKITYIKKEF